VKRLKKGKTQLNSKFGGERGNWGQGGLKHNEEKEREVLGGTRTISAKLAYSRCLHSDPSRLTQPQLRKSAINSKSDLEEEA